MNQVESQSLPQTFSSVPLDYPNLEQPNADILALMMPPKAENSVLIPTRWSTVPVFRVYEVEVANHKYYDSSFDIANRFGTSQETKGLLHSADALIRVIIPQNIPAESLSFEVTPAVSLVSSFTNVTLGTTVPTSSTLAQETQMIQFTVPLFREVMTRSASDYVLSSGNKRLIHHTIQINGIKEGKPVTWYIRFKIENSEIRLVSISSDWADAERITAIVRGVANTAKSAGSSVAGLFTCFSPRKPSPASKPLTGDYASVDVN